VVVEFGKKEHIGSIGRIGLQVHVGMRDDRLLECVKCNNPASAVIEGIGRLSKIGAPANETKLGEACLYIFENVLLNQKNVARELSATLHGYRRANLD